MSGPDKKPPEEDFDWDKALSEWDKQPLAPHVAEESQDPPAVVPEPAPAAAALYRPPTKTAPAAIESEEQDSFEDRTRMAAPPAKPPRPPPPPVGKPGKGGLGQLFSRDAKPDADEDVDVLLEDLPAPDPDVVTSAVSVETRAIFEEQEPLRRPAKGDEAANVPEGAMFDPFAEPESKPTVAPDPGLEVAPVAIPRAAAAPPAPAEAPAQAPAPAPAPQLLAPAERQHDPDADTSLGTDVSQLREALEKERGSRADEEPPMEVRPSELELEQFTSVPPPEPGVPVAAGDAVLSWDDERPAVAWLEEDARAEMFSRAEWLLEEARSVPDKPGRARAILAVSELLAIAGDRDRARELAVEAHELAPQLPIAERQVRSAYEPSEQEKVVESLDQELRNAPTPAAKLHATLYAATLLAQSGDADGAAKRLEAAARMAPTDARVVSLRAAKTLSKGELSSPALRVADAPAIAPLAAAIGDALRTRGIERKDAGVASPNDALRRARLALEKGDAVAAADRVAELRAIPEVANAALWLASALAASRTTSRPKSVEWLRALGHADADLAKRALAARGLELGDAAIVREALEDGDAFGPTERVALAAFAVVDAPRLRSDLEALSSMEGFAPLVSAASSVMLEQERSQRDDPDARARAVTAHADRAAGGKETRAAVRLARLIALGAGEAEVDAAVVAIRETLPEQAAALELDAAARAARWAEVAEALGRRGEGEAQNVARALAAALVAERAGLAERAVQSYRAALAENPRHEASLRALASLDSETSWSTSLRALAADESDPLAAALAQLELAFREGTFDAPESAATFERIHRLAPSLAVGAFFAERLARRAGDVDEVLKWVRERRAGSTDSLERALDAVREALLVADTDAGLAAERLEEAHRARPDDVALRELYERLAPEPPADRASWRESRGTSTQGTARLLMLIEAAYEFERSGDREGALRAARAAAVGDEVRPIARVALERAELGAGEAARLADELLVQARSAPDVRARLEAFERLADLDQNARNDPASALLWHRSILEETPSHRASLRYVEQALLGERRDDELEPVAGAIAQALKGVGGGEAAAHAVLAGRLRMRGGDWDGTKDLAALAAAEPEPTLWALRLANAHARAADDNARVLATTLSLLERASKPGERAVLAVRAAEAALRAGENDKARELLERAAADDPGDVVTWELLAEARNRANDAAGSAEAFESLARTSGVEEHRLDAWYAAALAWQTASNDDRAIAALEQASSVNVTYKDVFVRLSALYGKRGSRAELAALLERRISTVLDPDERVSLEVDRGRALAEVGDAAGAKVAYEAALAVQPDHVPALAAFAELAATQQDWSAAEQAWVRLARLEADPSAQRRIYERLGELYLSHVPNLSRAEVAFQEVRKRAPDDDGALEQLVRVYKKQNDAARALELQQELLSKSPDHATKKRRLIELASVYETVSHDNRKAEQTLEAARREFPTDVSILRALAEFHLRHKQEPAVKILLDRAGGDATRAFAAGRFNPALFETMVTVYELRGNHEAAQTVASALAAFTGKPAAIRGAEARALDPRLDDLLAPEALTPPMRALLSRTGDALDAAVPFDARTARATPMAADGFGRTVMTIAQSIGLPQLQAFTSPGVGRAIVPVSSNPPALVVGEPLLSSTEDAPRTWLLLRALKLIMVRGSAFARVGTTDAPTLVAGWLKAFNPTWNAPGLPAAGVAEAQRRVTAALPKNMDADLGMMALEAATSLGPQLGALAASVVFWANHAALLAVGDPNAALEAIAWTSGRGMPTAPTAEAERATWIGRTLDAKDIIAVSVSAQYSEARARLGLNRS